MIEGNKNSPRNQTQQQRMPFNTRERRRQNRKISLKKPVIEVVKNKKSTEKLEDEPAIIEEAIVEESSVKKKISVINDNSAKDPINKNEKISEVENSVKSEKSVIEEDSVKNENSAKEPMKEKEDISKVKIMVNKNKLLKMIKEKRETFKQKEILENKLRKSEEETRLITGQKEKRKTRK